MCVPLLVEKAQADVIVMQEVITGEADYGSGRGQSFLLPAGGTASQIQLHIGSTGNGGGSISVSLWEATGGPGSHFGRLSGSPVATGLLDRADISATTEWYTITLSQPYINQTPIPVYLVFEMELLTAGLSGWNNYSFSNQESYTDGHAVYWSGSEYVIRDGIDQAFRILDSVPAEKPKVEITLDPAQSLITISVPNTAVGYEYTCFVDNDLSRPIEYWQNVSTQPGNGGVINWYFHINNNPATQFYYIEYTASNN
ncbi:MAG: hypothetical protein AAF571_00560 [Verrucomicrobiota bacterium]